MRTKLVAVDLDGTLLTGERTLAPGGVRSLRQAIHQGVFVVLSTTRNPVGTRLTVIVPSRGVQSLAVVRADRSEPIRIGDETVEARVYELEVAGSSLVIWVDGGGRVLQVAAPDENRVATRLPDDD